MRAPVPCRARRRRARRSGRALLAALALAAAPTSARAADVGPVVYDLVWVRPIAAVHTLAGAIAFVPVGLLALPSGTVREAFITFVMNPTVDLYRRPLGEF